MPGVEPDPPRCKRGALPVELHPRGSCGRVESNHHSQRRRRYRPVSSPLLSVRVKGGRPDLNRRRGDHGPECCRLHHGHSGDGRTRTGGISPDKRALYAH
jgi:hypothetical protein